MNINKDKKNIVIAGGGFAGLSAVQSLYREGIIQRDYNLILIDKKDNFDFLPLAPDVVAGWLHPRCAQANLTDYVKRRGAHFLRGNIMGFDIDRASINVDEREIKYDYLILACGGEPNFFGNRDFQQQCLTLNSVEDAIRINNILTEKIKEKPFCNIAVIGGGYTGVEIATACRFLLNKGGVDAFITIIEKAEDILLNVPDWLRRRVRERLKKMHIDVFCDDGLKRYENNTLYSLKGKEIPDCVCIWSAGVRSADFIEKTGMELIKKRIEVQSSLQIKNAPNGNIFAIGDNAAFRDPKNGEPIRMAVKFSIDQGKVAARNIIHIIRGQKLDRYEPVDLGFLIPMTESYAPGIVFNSRVPGRVGFFLHYLMCAYRSSSKNRWGIIKGLTMSRRILNRPLERRENGRGSL